MGKEYGDIPRGIFLIRGENMVLCGEIVRIYILLNWGCFGWGYGMPSSVKSAVCHCSIVLKATIHYATLLHATVVTRL